MKPTKHATTNFRMLKPVLDGLNGGTHRRYEMELRVNHTAGTVEPLTFRNDYMGIFPAPH